MKAIIHAKSFVTIIKEEVNTVIHSQNSLFFNNTCLWIKREDDPDFDVTLSSFDGADICEPVDVYILKVFGEKYGKERVGLYRDDILVSFETVSGRQAKKINKEVIKIFKEEFNANITSETKLKIINLLYITFKRSMWKYQPETNQKTN